MGSKGSIAEIVVGPFIDEVVGPGLLACGAANHQFLGQEIAFETFVAELFGA